MSAFLETFYAEQIEPRRADIDRVRRQYPDSRVTYFECARCGWSVTAHPIPGSYTSGFWNCPNGASPAARDGRIKPRRSE